MGQSQDSLFSPGTVATSVLLHVLCFGAFAALSCSALKHKPEEIEVMDITVVIDENLDKPPDDLKPDDKPKPPPPAPKPFVKGQRTKRTEPKKPEFVKGQRAVGNGPRTEKKLSEDEIRRLLAMGARPGTRNQVPTDELSRCFSLIKMKFCDIWDRQKPAWSPNLGVAQLQLTFGPGGRVVKSGLVKSSGDAEVDRSILSAARTMGAVAGLTVDFLREHPVVTIDCEVMPE